MGFFSSTSVEEMKVYEKWAIFGPHNMQKLHKMFSKSSVELIESLELDISEKLNSAETNVLN